MLQGQAVTVTVTVLDVSTGHPAAGSIAATLSLWVAADKAAKVVIDSSAVQDVDDGECEVSLTARQNSGRMMTVAGDSSNPNFVVIARKWENEPPRPPKPTPTPPAPYVPGVGVGGDATSLRTVSPEDPVHEGCAVRVKTRNIVVEAGIPSIVNWTMRNAKGQTLDLSSVLPAPQEPHSVSLSEAPYGSIQVRFASADVPGCCTGQRVDGVCIAPSSGQLQFELPPSIYDHTGIYRMGVGILDATGRPVCIENALIFIEPGLWGAGAQGAGPPSLKELRTYLRDTRPENDFLRDVEFSDEEILMAIIGPIREWNEMLPPVAPMSCQTFPWREMWIKAVIGQLCRTAAAWYLRNKMNISHGGVSTDDRNKNAEYNQQAEMYITEWRTAARAKKVQINISRGFGGVDGPYH